VPAVSGLFLFAMVALESRPLKHCGYFFEV
jgi:hypothetical protein